MKHLLLFSFLALTSFSAFATCEMDMMLAEDASEVILFLEDKEDDKAREVEENIVGLIGGNPEKLDCEELIKEIKKKGKTVEVEGEKIPLKIIHTINL